LVPSDRFVTPEYACIDKHHTSRWFAVDRHAVLAVRTALPGYRLSILILITYRDCLTERAIQRSPAMCDQLAPCGSGIARSSPRKRVTSALTHWPH
jgi:hypothetical protein